MKKEYANNLLIKKKNELVQLEKKLDGAYYELGKATNEYMNTKKNIINQLVDEIILTKQQVFKIEEVVEKEGK